MTDFDGVGTDVITNATCPVCNSELAPGVHFCIHCGTAVAPDTQTFGCPFACQRCGGDGSRLPAATIYCPQCRWLRPLGPRYALTLDAFMWRQDADAMNVLRSLGPLTAAARMVSERVGRPWLEASVNGLRLSERQLPDIFAQAVRAARIMALSYLPEIYVSGEQMWDAMTLGTDTSAFIVLGSVLTNFKGDDLLFVLGREMGHCRAGHALWKTVTQFVSGRSQRRTIMGDGVLKLFNPAKLVESAVDAPLMAWARQAEITADRAGLLVVGKEEVARRVLMTWTLRSFPLQQRIDADAFREQEDAAEDVTQRVSEWMLSSTPYIAGRLKLMREFARSAELTGWRAVIEHWSPPEPPERPEQPQSAQAQPATVPMANALRAAATPLPTPLPTPSPPDSDVIRLVCVSCKEPMRVPKAALDGRNSVNVRCPNAACRSVLTVRLTKPKEPEKRPSTIP